MKIADGLLAGISMALLMTSCGDQYKDKQMQAQTTTRDTLRPKAVIVDTATAPAIDTLGEPCPPCGRG